MTEEEYINMKNLVTLRIVQSSLSGLISDKIVTDSELNSLRASVEKLIMKYQGKIITNSTIPLPRKTWDKDHPKPSHMQYLFFRDNSHLYEKNSSWSFHAAGIVDKKFSENSESGKDLSVSFINPFNGEVIHAWRQTNEVELFEVDEGLYHTLSNILNTLSW